MAPLIRGVPPAELPPFPFRQAGATQAVATQAIQGLMTMSEEAEKARQALQESMDLREQGHSDD